MHRFSLMPFVRRALLGLVFLVAASAPQAASGSNPMPRSAAGRVHDATGAPVVGAMVSFAHGRPAHSITVFSDDEGRFRTPAIRGEGPFAVRVRRIGWKDSSFDDVNLVPGLDLVVERETDPAAVAAQLPANYWYALVLDAIEDRAQREELKQQCTYCHQQGNWATRRVRSDEEWRKLLMLMGRMGGMVSKDLREKIPGVFNAAYDPAHAVPILTRGMDEPGFAPPPPPRVRRAIVEEWELGGRASVQHDVMFHPDGRLYSVDMSEDMLYRLDPRVPGGGREQWLLPQGDLPLGGAFAVVDRPLTPTSNARVGPHSLQHAPDGSVWITLALGNRLARFDPQAESFEVHELEHGYYPHTLRFDPRGRIWYTIAASNHVGMFDPATGEQREFRLPARNFSQSLVLRALPLLLWAGRHVDLRGAAGEADGITMPIPYGIDIAPDGGVWFSQLNEHKIGRIDPRSFEIEMIPTPFPTPRRLRFDSAGRLWIPSFSGNLVARFDLGTRKFDHWELPIEPLGSEVPYALNVDRRNDDVWICGTNSDSLIRFEPDLERFSVYPLPTRVSYTREIDFDDKGRIWTSNSNGPTWQIEGGVPRVIRLDPNPAIADDGAAVVRKQARPDE
ncbi:MAG: carboxypeptidase regulatory-like domain-containing protein [Deltaproteobacteria bacterium]|nr:carboxypeptidase regulatory-like domain-containing protein [Deltaproteobacteria bacterium]